jgi:hypothetical protein
MCVNSIDALTSGNRFRDTSLTVTERQRALKAFQLIKTLRLEETLLSWEEVRSLYSVWFSFLTDRRWQI